MKKKNVLTHCRVKNNNNFFGVEIFKIKNRAKILYRFFFIIGGKPYCFYFWIFSPCLDNLQFNNIQMVVVRNFYLQFFFFFISFSLLNQISVSFLIEIISHIHNNNKQHQQK